MNTSPLAAANLLALSQKVYPGRIVCAGLTSRGDPFLSSVIEGRGKESRNRGYIETGQHGWVKTRAADPSEVTADENLLYDAMAEKVTERGGIYVASNGHHGPDVLDKGIDALGGWSYESDRSKTARITALTEVMSDGTCDMTLAILRKSLTGDGCRRTVYRDNQMELGNAYYLSTYEDDGDPLPPFVGGPRIIPIIGVEAESIADELWAVLEGKNLVSIAVKIMPFVGGPSEVCIINQYKLVG